MAHIKTKLKALVPPALLNLLRGQTLSFAGDYTSWDAANLHASGYEAEEILRRVATATRKVVAGEAVYERDSVLFDHVEYAWPLLASLLQVALESKSLRVIDFGGSLGSTWWQNRRYLERLDIQLAWRVVEQEHFVAVGSREFSSRVLSFHRTISDASEGGADVVLCSSSLCYVRDPIALMDEIDAAPCRYLIIDRLPMVPGDRDRIALQKVTRPIYDASYPVRIFAENNLLGKILGRWRLIERWICDLQPDPNTTSHGFFMEKR
jgi:putative methyltransferase (TIGR04325 family)